MSFPKTRECWEYDIIGLDIVNDMKPEALDRRFQDFISSLGEEPDYGDVYCTVLNASDIYPAFFSMDHYDQAGASEITDNLIECLKEDGFELGNVTE
jgi:hypothetical protein